MNTTEAMWYPPAFMDELDKAIQSLSKPRDPQALREASVRMDRMREELRQKYGDMEIPVDLIRDVRDAE